MEYEIDFLPVGEGNKSGDAICLRYSYDNCNTWHVGVIDGGTQNSGEALCDHIKKFYETETVDFLICTHPDQDHASGLSVVLEKMSVQKVLMHCPWDYTDHIYEAVNDGRVTKESLRQKLIDGHPFAYKVYEVATEKGIPIFHPFSDLNNHGIPALSVVGPSSDFYLSQVINFRSITDYTEDLESEGLVQSILEAAMKAANWIVETWNEETLVNPDHDATSSENNSSVISFFNFDDERILLTADAGVHALDQAADKIQQLGHELQAFSFFQVPHHGSKRNIGPEVLDKLVGEPKLFGHNPEFTAFVSAAEDGEPKHPNKRVVNAFIRRGGKVVATKGNTMCHYNGEAPDRGWIPAEPLPFYEQVEDDD
ncbi:MAG: hypothetical protein RPU12_09145 [Candidatus Sedimenticola sp. (ex Thyasira tokunagai)]